MNFNYTHLKRNREILKDYSSAIDERYSKIIRGDKVQRIFFIKEYECIKALNYAESITMSEFTSPPCYQLHARMRALQKIRIFNRELYLRLLRCVIKDFAVYEFYTQTRISDLHTIENSLLLKVDGPLAVGGSA